ncbi:MAG: MarR family winged helix-turn-helix transcriptional regulator [Thiohalomonadales bacterium]
MFDRCLYFNVNALARVVNRKWTESFAVFDLSPAHAYLLRIVLSRPGITSKELSAELQLEKSTISRFVDVLQKKKLLIRKKSMGGDAREQNIYPTSKAIKMHAALDELGENLYQAMLSEIGEKQLAVLVKQLRSSANKIK